MVHLFNCLNRSFVLDVYSGSFFEVDKYAKEVIEYKLSGKSFDCFSSEFDMAKREIGALESEGILFSYPPDFTVGDFDGVIKSMCLNVSHECNLRCAYCFASGGDYNQKSADKHMSVDTAKAAIDFLVKRSGKNKNLEIDFFGGEPLCNMLVLTETIKYARSLEKKHNKNFRFTLTTNALDVSSSAIDVINNSMDNVVLSIDGRKSVHNLMRKTKEGKDSYSQILANAKAITKTRRKSYFVRGTYTAKNLDFVSDIKSLIKEGFTNLSLESVVLKKGHSLAIENQHVIRICNEYEKLAEYYIDERKKGNWITFFHFNLNLYDGPCEKKLLRSCGAGCGYVAVTPEGKIYPCHQFIGKTAFEMGDILKNTYDKNIAIKFFRENHVLQKPKCKECWAKYYCGGGCAAHNQNSNGNLLTPDEVSCTLMKKRIECALAIFAIENE